MEEMKTVIDEYKKILEKFIGDDRKRGCSLIVWDGDRMMRAETGLPRTIVHSLAAAIGDIIGETMKEEKIGIDNLRRVMQGVYDETLNESLAVLGKRLGDEKMQAMAESYVREHGIEIVEEEEELADAIGRSAESDDGAGEV